jgi:hypothetical protein
MTDVEYSTPKPATALRAVENNPRKTRWRTRQIFDKIVVCLQ